MAKGDLEKLVKDLQTRETRGVVNPSGALRVIHSPSKTGGKPAGKAR